MNSRKRTVKQVSFAANDYEDELLEYATKPEHGPFSVYIKRLIAQDRDACNRPIVGGGSAVISPPKPVATQKDRDDATSFL